MPPEYIDSECYRLLNAPSLPEWRVGSRGGAAYWRLISYDGLAAKISLFTLAKSVLRHSAKHVLHIKCLLWSLLEFGSHVPMFSLLQGSRKPLISCVSHMTA